MLSLFLCLVLLSGLLPMGALALTGDVTDPVDETVKDVTVPANEPVEDVTDSVDDVSAPEGLQADEAGEADSVQVSGDEIAADGTYTATLQGYKNGEAKSGYTATLNVVVADGKIASLYLSDVKKDKMTTAFNKSGYQHYLNIDASVSAVEAINIDAVSGATTSANAGASYKYSIDLASALKTALGKAEEAASDGKAKISLGATTLTVQKDNTGTVTVTPKNCTDITVSSDNDTVATATVSDNTITVTGIARGTATITVSGTPEDAFEAPESVTLTVNVVEYVQGDEIAADGTYSAAIKAYSYGSTSGSAKYSSTVYVTVQSGLITAITFSGGDSSKFTDYLINGKKDDDKINIAGGAYYGVVASPSAVDAITSATIAAGTTTTKKYTHTLESAVSTAIKSADKAEDQRAPSTIKLSASSLTVDKNATGSVTATVSGCAVTGAVSGNTAVATAEVSGNTITVTGVYAGTATITVSGAENDGYRTPADVSFTVTVTPAAEDLISGDDVAADGTYSATIKAYKSGTVKYTATINVTVTGGVVSNVTFTGNDAGNFNKYYSNMNISSYLDRTASLNAFGADAATSATTNNGNGKYTIDVKQGIYDALSTAPKAVGIPMETISGDQIAADGTYTSTFVIDKYKKGKLDKSYTAQLNVSVADGVIAGLWLSNYSDSKVAKYITNDVYNAYIGQTASLNAVSAINLDAVSSATISTTGGTDSSKEKYYSGNLNDAVYNALSYAPPAEGSGSGSQTADAFYISDTISAGDSEGSAITVKVSAANGTIIDVTLHDDGIVGSWSSLLSRVKSNYVGKTASVDAVDAVTAATMYSAAVKSAVKNALDKGRDVLDNLMRIAHKEVLEEVHRAFAVVYCIVEVKNSHNFHHFTF